MPPYCRQSSSFSSLEAAAITFAPMTGTQFYGSKSNAPRLHREPGGFLLPSVLLCLSAHGRRCRMQRQRLRPWIKVIPSGIGIVTEALATTSSANPPQIDIANTFCPGFRWLTPSPTSLMTPDISPPGENGSSGLNWYFPSMIRVSGKFTPQAFVEINT